MAGCNEISVSVTERESSANVEEKVIATSKQLLYSEYFDKDDVFEKSFLNPKKAPVFQSCQTSGVLSRVKQFATVIEKDEAEFKLKSSDEYNIELVEKNKPAIEFSFELYKDDDESDDEANDPALNENDALSNNENSNKAQKIIEIVNSDSSDCDSDDELLSNRKSNSSSKLESGSDSESTSGENDFLQPRQKRLRTG